MNAHGFSVLLQKRSSMKTLGADVKRLRGGALFVGKVKDIGLISERNLRHAEGKDILRLGDITKAVNNIHAHTTCDLRDVLRRDDTVELEVWTHNLPLCNLVEQCRFYGSGCRYDDACRFMHDSHQNSVEERRLRRVLAIDPIPSDADDDTFVNNDAQVETECQPCTVPN